VTFLKTSIIIEICRQYFQIFHIHILKSTDHWDMQLQIPDGCAQAMSLQASSPRDFAVYVVNIFE